MRTRAAVIREPGEPWELTELELDEPRRGEVLIKFAASGMCHSDEHLRTGGAVGRLPLVGGHEGAGVVEAVGEGVTRVSPGDRVGVAALTGCGVPTGWGRYIFC
jgi:alcohol dehydrogenase (nicotinoprotein)